MFGLDDHIARLSNGTSILLVLVVAVVLGLRHASDPDHLAAVTTLVASGKDGARRRAARLGLLWGAGHGTSLFLFGLPIVLFRAYLPEPVQEGAETAVGAIIVALAVWLLVRWRRGAFHVHPHAHGQYEHLHLHRHETAGHGHGHSVKARSPLQAYGIGLVHGIGGSAGVGVLLLATIHDQALAVGALLLFAAFTAVSMALLSAGFGVALGSRGVQRSFQAVAPVIGTVSLAFGIWYGLGALHVAPYVF
jgi:ABC-type nickel/cobalt efflux system permease component RcnA